MRPDGNGCSCGKEPTLCWRLVDDAAGSSDLQHVDEIWHLRAPSPDRVGINAIAAWQTTQGDEQVRVILYDLGVEFDHPALRGRIDLSNGRNFDHTTNQKGLLLAEPSRLARLGKVGRVDDPLDAHGTACAGVACATRDLKRAPSPPSDKSFIGVAPGCLLTPIRISTNFEAECLIGALEHAVEVAAKDWGG